VRHLGLGLAPPIEDRARDLALLPVDEIGEVQRRGGGEEVDAERLRSGPATGREGVEDLERIADGDVPQQLGDRLPRTRGLKLGQHLAERAS